MSWDQPSVTYRHANSEERFRQYASDPLPPWAVDVRDDIECPDCEGVGQVDDPEPCPSCGYRGCRTMACVTCNGEGRVAPEEDTGDESHHHHTRGGDLG